MSPIFLSFLQLYVFMCRGEGRRVPRRARGFFFFKDGRAVELTSRDGKEIIELIADKLPVAKHSNRRWWRWGWVAGRKDGKEGGGAPSCAATIGRKESFFSFPLLSPFVRLSRQKYAKPCAPTVEKLGRLIGQSPPNLTWTTRVPSLGCNMPKKKKRKKGKRKEKKRWGGREKKYESLLAGTRSRMCEHEWMTVRR